MAQNGFVTEDAAFHMGQRQCAAGGVVPGFCMRVVMTEWAKRSAEWRGDWRACVRSFAHRGSASKSAP